MSAALDGLSPLGAALGLLAGAGLWLVLLGAPVLARPRLDARLAPHLVDSPRGSRLLAPGRAPAGAAARLLGTAPGGRTTLRVLPHGPVDRLILNGYRADVWMPPGVSAETVRAQAGRARSEPAIGAVEESGDPVESCLGLEEGPVVVVEDRPVVG
mgnify:CR=1 FL=1